MSKYDEGEYKALWRNDREVKFQDEIQLEVRDPSASF